MWENMRCAIFFVKYVIYAAIAWSL